MTPSEIGKAMRALPSAKRDAAVRENIKRAQAARRNPAIPCTCRVARSDGTHEWRCRLGQAEKARQKRAAKRASVD